MFRKTLLGMILLSILTISALAVPNQLTYSGRLLQNGALVNATLTMTFKIWSDLTAGTQLWATSNITVPVNQGIYSIVLDQVSPNVFVTDNAYLEVIIDPLGTPETLAPRTKINSVGYALQAGGLSAGGVQVVAVTVSGNVGIGTTSPDSLNDRHPVLEIASRTPDLPGVVLRSGHPSYPENWEMFLNANSGAGSGFNINVGTTNVVHIRRTGNMGISTANPQAKLHVWNSTSNAFLVETRPTAGAAIVPALFANAAGYVGIWTTNPGARLEVFANSVDTTGGDFQISEAHSAGNGDIRFGVETTNHLGYIQAHKWATGYSSLLVNPNGGNVGIGTTAPGAKLHIAGGSILLDNNQYVIIKSKNGNNPGALSIDNTGTYGTLYLGDSSSIDGIGFRPGASEKMRIDSAGNVGIGITNPGAPLEVAGNSTKTAALGVLNVRNTAESPVGVAMAAGTTGKLYLNNDSSGSVIIAGGGGNVGIGQAATAEKLAVYGNVKYGLWNGGIIQNVYTGDAGNTPRTIASYTAGPTGASFLVMINGHGDVNQEQSALYYVVLNYNGEISSSPTKIAGSTTYTFDVSGGYLRVSGLTLDWQYSMTVIRNDY
ncbi:MAG: hypothetical protein WC838_01210 [Candidatus Margulisiibacteriota bacterium]|jgi:hypothetical protein